jgi:hypothetical protein
MGLAMAHTRLFQVLKRPDFTAQIEEGGSLVQAGDYGAAHRSYYNVREIWRIISSGFTFVL